MRIDYTLRLCSDAEPGSGFGNELLNSRVPVNAAGNIILPASHLKGLLRENMETYLPDLKYVPILHYLFGDVGMQSGEQAGALFFSDAEAPQNTVPVPVSRTKIGKYGIAENTSLRTTEAIPRGTELHGFVELRSDTPELLPFVEYALLTLYAVGGKRNRGAGECFVTLDGKPELSPEQLQEKLNPAIKLPARQFYNSQAKLQEDNGKTVFLQLRFNADSPVCLPETPLGKQNTISSGFAIPGSAVVGMVLTAISNQDSDLASALFTDPRFRCWPLHPAIDGSDRFSCRVSSSHKISKLRGADGFLFGDLMVEDKYLEQEYRWQEKAKNTAMKGCDGVLCSHDGKITLWKSQEMPRLLTAHGVHHGTEGKERNLFTVVSMAVKHFWGLVSLPQSVAERVLKLLENGVPAFAGKSRSIRGGGTLSAAPFDVSSLPQIPALKNRLFIVQSPILLSGNPDNDAPIQKILEQCVQLPLEESSGARSLRFGWNSEAQGKRCSDNSNRLQARQVISPGSVLLLKEPVEDLEAFLAAGLGAKDPGFGALFPHPGIAQNSWSTQAELRRFSNTGDSAQTAYRLHGKVGMSLSASQISALMTMREKGVSESLKYLENQKNRTAEIGDQWEPVKNLLEKEILLRPDAVKILKIWHDLRVAEKRGK